MKITKDLIHNKYLQFFFVSLDQFPCLDLEDRSKIKLS